jgi:hypothetical protein
MKDDQLLPKRSLAGSAGQLWRRSIGWKLVLLGATICTGLYLLNPPWEWKSADPVAARHLQSTPIIRSAATTARPAQNVRTAPPSAAPMTAMQAQARPRDIPQPEGITSQIAIADENCGSGGPMHVPLTPRPAVAGRIEGFLPNAEAMALIPRSEESVNGRIDPAYLHNLRALFHPDDAAPQVRLAVLIPADMNVYVGEQVEMVGGHASPNLACRYVPNLIVAGATDP